jgi:hypothetical protein
VLVLVTFRSDELHRTHPLRPLLAELDRVDGIIRQELPRLSSGQVEAQLEGILGGPPGPAVTSAVYERGGGIPLFTEALVNADGTVSLGVQWSPRDQLLGAVKELPERTQQVLRCSAAAGVRVGHELLAAVTGLDDLPLAAVPLHWRRGDHERAIRAPEPWPPCGRLSCDRHGSIRCRCRKRLLIAPN